MAFVGESVGWGECGVGVAGDFLLLLLLISVGIAVNFFFVFCFLITD